jgi:hypothetical protein
LEVDVQQDNFKILQLLPQVLILFLVEKLIPPSRSETTKIGQKKEGILGVNMTQMLWFKGNNLIPHYSILPLFRNKYP